MSKICYTVINKSSGGKDMINSKEWDWNAVEREAWLTPSEESYYYAEKWRRENRRRLLDLGCGLGRHSIFFSEKGFDVSACDLSECGVEHLRSWQKENGVSFPTAVCDMKKLPYEDGSFDCIYAYHVLSHADTEGFKQTLSEVHRVLRAGGEIFFDLCSKDSWSFTRSGYPRIDENSLRFVGGIEDGIPHFFVDREDIDKLMDGFALNKVRHIFDLDTPLSRGGGTHYFIEADKA